MKKVLFLVFLLGFTLCGRTSLFNEVMTNSETAKSFYLNDRDSTTIYYYRYLEAKVNVPVSSSVDVYIFKQSQFNLAVTANNYTGFEHASLNVVGPRLVTHNYDKYETIYPETFVVFIRCRSNTPVSVRIEVTEYNSAFATAMHAIKYAMEEFMKAMIYLLFVLFLICLALFALLLVVASIAGCVLRFAFLQSIALCNTIFIKVNDLILKVDEKDLPAMDEIEPTFKNRLLHFWWYIKNNYLPLKVFFGDNHVDNMNIPKRMLLIVLSFLCVITIDFVCVMVSAQYIDPYIQRPPSDECYSQCRHQGGPCFFNGFNVTINDQLSILKQRATNHTRLSLFTYSGFPNSEWWHTTCGFACVRGYCNPNNFWRDNRPACNSSNHSWKWCYYNIDDLEKLETNVNRQVFQASKGFIFFVPNTISEVIRSLTAVALIGGVYTTFAFMKAARFCCQCLLWSYICCCICICLFPIFILAVLVGSQQSLYAIADYGKNFAWRTLFLQSLVMPFVLTMAIFIITLKPCAYRKDLANDAKAKQLKETKKEKAKSFRKKDEKSGEEKVEEPPVQLQQITTTETPVDVVAPQVVNTTVTEQQV